MSPHSANIDRAKFEQQCGGILAHAQPDLARGMTRIEYSDPAKASDRTREILGKNRNANIFRMMAHSPSYFEQYCRLGGAIRHRGELDPLVR